MSKPEENTPKALTQTLTTEHQCFVSVACSNTELFFAFDKRRLRRTCVIALFFGGILKGVFHHLLWVSRLS